MKKPSSPSQPQIHPALAPARNTYGMHLGIKPGERLRQLDVEFVAFRDGWPTEKGGLGRYRHFKNIARMLLPQVQWNPWTEDKIRSLTDEEYIQFRGDMVYREVVWAGCAAAGKTHDAAFYAILWWLADPANSLVVLTSTTAAMVKKRIWQPLASFYHAMGEIGGGNAGIMVESKTIIKFKPGDELHAIFGKAVGEGETSKAAADIQGMHTKRILVVLDEATDVNPAILMAVENMKIGCSDFTLLFIGNAKSTTDPLGRAMEPANGWESITVESEEWRTKNGGVCLHFDGYKSPNVKAGKTLYPYLFTWENYQTWTQSGKEDTLECWMYARGFPPPDGVLNTVFSSLMVEQCQGKGKHVFLSRKRTIAALDPAFGGDDCILRFAEIGDIEGDRMGVQLTETIKIETIATSTLPREHQITQRVIAECQKRGVTPEAFGQDATGTGRGLFAILQEKFGLNVHKVDFAGAATDHPSSESDPRPGHEVYANRVSELWFMARPLLESGQLKGLDPETIREMCARQYVMKGARYCIEPKKDYKSRVGRSPDNADALVVLLDVARKLGATPKSTLAKQAANNWLQVAAHLDSVHIGRDDSPVPGAGRFDFPGLVLTDGSYFDQQE